MASSQPQRPVTESRVFTEVVLRMTTMAPRLASPKPHFESSTTGRMSVSSTMHGADLSRTHLLCFLQSLSTCICCLLISQWLSSPCINEKVCSRSCKRSNTLFQKSLLLFLTWREYFYSQLTHFSSQPKK